MYFVDWAALLPLLLVAGLGLLTMLISPFVKSDQARVGYLALAGLVGTAVYTASYWAANPTKSVTMMADMAVVDGFTLFFYLLLMMIAGVVIAIALPYLARDNFQRGEFYCLVLFSLVGMLVIVSSNDLMTLFLGFETMSLAIYALVGWRRHAVASNEAALKYYFLGAFAAGIFLYGIALAYGASGTTNLGALRALVLSSDVMAQPLLVIGMLLILVALAFKVAAFPFHMWTPDAYEGAPTPVTAFMATAVKAAAFALVLRFFVTTFAVDELRLLGTNVVWWLAALTMFAGNVFALVQTNIKRMLAYSGIAHTGYLLVAVVALPDVDAAAAVLFYLVAYAFTNLGALACVSFLGSRDERVTNIDDIAGVAWRYPLVAFGLAVCMFSLIGFPPTAGFFGKYYLFIAAIKAGFLPLALVAIVNSILSIYYYLRVVIVMYMKPEEGVLEPAKVPFATKAVVVYTTAAVIWAGIGIINLTGFLPGAGPLLDSAKRGATALLAPPQVPTAKR